MCSESDNYIHTNIFKYKSKLCNQRYFSSIKRAKIIIFMLRIINNILYNKHAIITILYTKKNLFNTILNS